MITPVAGLLEDVLVPAASDAAVDVRAIARDCLTAIQFAFPERELLLSQRLDSPTRPVACPAPTSMSRY